jgi:lysophospholipase L1-like esterase
VVIVGDSLTGGNSSYIVPTLRSAGLDARVEGLSSRRIAVSFNSLGYRDSGIERVRSLRAAGVEPELWVIQLGTNDLASVKNCGCADPVAFAGTLVKRLLDELPADTPVAWVTVMNRTDYEVTNTFNEALRRLAVLDPYMRLIDWGGLSLQRPDWFMDPVHQSFDGVVRFTQMYIDEIRALLASPPGPTAPQPGIQPAVRLGSPFP